MRSSVKNAWIVSIRKAVKHNFPSFQENINLKHKGRNTLFEFNKVNNGINCFITFRLLDSESFDVFIGWTKNKKITFSKYFDSNMKDKYCFDQEYFMATSMEISERSGAASWNFWTPPDEALDNDELFSQLYCEHFLTELSDFDAEKLVSLSIGEAIKEIKTYCIPYLNNVLEQKKQKGR